MLSNTLGTWATYRNTFERKRLGYLQEIAFKRTTPIVNVRTIKLDEKEETLNNMAALGEIESASSSTTLRPSQEEYTPLEQAVRFELSDSIGTVFSDVRLSSLLREQLDELLLLVAERGVVIFENQADFSTSTKDEIISYWDPGYVSAIAEGDNQYLDAPSQAQDQWHTDASYETTPPSFSLLNIEGEQEKLGETAWVSQYGTYDELSKPLQRLVSELTAVHTSGQHTASHPAVRTHPVTGWRTLNVTPEDVVRLPEINKKESGT